MPGPSFPDINDLLIPFAEPAAAGIDARLDPAPNSIYQQIKSARNAARSAERSSLFGEPSQEAADHWRTVLDLSPDFIAHTGKDLEVACWLTEALIRRDGFSGLRTACELLLGLIDQHWETLYPLPDEDGLETRVAPLAGLNGEGAEGVLIAPIRNTLITQGNSTGPFSYWEYHQALEAQRLPEEKARNERIRKLGFCLENIDQAIRETSTAFLVGLRDDIEACLANFRAISDRLDNLCGAADAPPARNILNILEECQAAILHLGQGRFPASTQAPADGAAPTDGAILPLADAPPITQPTVAGREQAFTQLKEIAEFFRTTEPHSPVSYLLEKAVKWGNMPLHELMSELIPDDSSLKHYGMLTGVKTDI